ncbi:MAG: tetratricopeptide repeat protein [Vampirovibrionia bacterium]
MLKLAEFYNDNGEIDRATDAFERLVELEPRNSEAVYNLASLMINKNILKVL